MWARSCQPIASPVRNDGHIESVVGSVRSSVKTLLYRPMKRKTASEKIPSRSVGWKKALVLRLSTPQVSFRIKNYLFKNKNRVCYKCDIFIKGRLRIFRSSAGDSCTDSNKNKKIVGKKQVFQQTWQSPERQQLLQTKRRSERIRPFVSEKQSTKLIRYSGNFRKAF